MSVKHLTKIAGAAAIAVIVAAALLSSAPAAANEIDLSTWTCRQFQSAAKEEIGLILAWLDGYYHGEDDPPVIDTNQLDARAKKLADYCAAHPASKLIAAADALFEQE